MKQMFKAGRRFSTAVVLIFYALYLQADVIQQSIFNTEQGYLPEDYLHAYPVQPVHCSSTGAASKFTEGFHNSGSMLETFSDGHSVAYQAMFAPYLPAGSGKEGIVWAGDLRALMIDELGRWRSDNGDKRLGSTQEDPLINSCYDVSAGLRRFRFSQSLKTQSSGKCNALNFPYQESDLGYLWRAAELLDRMTQQDASIQRYPFQSKASQRFIRTHIGQQEYDFVGTGDFPFEPAWFGLSSAEKAQQVIQFIRGRELQDWRSRTLNQQMYRLGDTLDAVPVHVARPVANFNLIYRDTSYQRFLNQYLGRRSRVFLSTHDGMLHAFNAGWYDPVNREHRSIPARGAGETEWDLGQEMWAFVPFDILPMLAHYADKDYGKKGREHLNLLSHAPYIFDARIFRHPGAGGVNGQADRRFVSVDGSVISQVTHPDGWGTVMVTGFGHGGGAFATEDARGKLEYFQPAYLVFDITDAEQAPKLLAYIRPPSLGSSLAQPAVVTRKNPQGELQWYLALGSGLDLDPNSMQLLRSRQSAKVFVYSLEDIDKDVKTGGEEIDLAMPASYVSGMSAADWYLDEVTDALYISATGVQDKSANNRWRSALLRISQTKAGSSWHHQKLLNLNVALSYRPQLTIDASKNRWLYLATGNVRLDKSTSGSVRNSIIGIKEARDPSGRFHMDEGAGNSAALSVSDLLSVERVMVNPINGDLLGSLRIAPALPRDNVLELEQRLMQYQQASEYIPGWSRALEDGEAASAQSILYGGFLSQSTHQLRSSSGGCPGDGKTLFINFVLPLGLPGLMST